MVLQCRKCEKSHNYKPQDMRWDFNGYGYDTKYVICPKCGRINIVKYIEDENFDVNNDERFYTYGVKGGE